MRVTRWGYVLLRSVVTLAVALTIGVSPWSPDASGSTATTTTASAAEMPLGATLMVLATPVDVQPSQTDAFVAATDGQMLGLGDSVRTGPGGLAVLTYFDGSETQLGSETKIQIERAEATPAPQIAFLQTAGVTMNHVVPMPAGGTFRTDTPAATGLVRGTSYVVVVGVSVNQPDNVHGATSVILLTDRDGHVGRVDVAGRTSSGLTPGQLSHAGDAAAADSGHSAGARVAKSTLEALEAAANAQYEPEAAREAEHYARSVASALVPLTAPGTVEHPAGVDGASPLAQDELPAVADHEAQERRDEQHLAERIFIARTTGSTAASAGPSSPSGSQVPTVSVGTLPGAGDSTQSGQSALPTSPAPTTLISTSSSPAPSVPAPVASTLSAPAPSVPAPVASTLSAPAPVAPAPVAPAPVAPAPVAPAPVAPAPTVAKIDDSAKLAVPAKP